MKRLFVLFACWPLLATAQRTEWDVAYKKSIPDSLTKPIRMPARDYNPHLIGQNGFALGKKTRKGVFAIQSDSLYRQFFWRYIYTDDSLKACKVAGCDPWQYKWMEKHHVDSLPVIDFAKQELLVYVACAQCLAFCHHAGPSYLARETPGQEPCHRNACNFRESWFIREKRPLARLEKEAVQ
jgi:hypothetical protein